MERCIKTSCPGSCGELFQGVLNGEEFILSYGIDLRSWAILSEGGQFPVVPRGQKVQEVLNLLPFSLFGILWQGSQLPIGKGFSSSTTDMLVSLGLAYSSAGKNLLPEDLTAMCTKIEATDSVAFGHWTVINPLTGRVLYTTQWKPNLYVYVLEPNHTQMTSQLPRMTESPHYPQKTSALLFGDFVLACEKEDLVAIGEIATRSSRLNNKRLPKPYLEDIIQLAEKYSFLGVNIAHSGTVVGILLKEEDLLSLSAFEDNMLSHDLSNYYQKRYLRKIIFEGVQIEVEECNE